MRAVTFVLVATLSFACRSTPAEATAKPAKASEALSVVSVVTASGVRHDVKVELAATEEDRARGLMFRRALGTDEGMLFVFPDETVLSFWMKNTLIPLDMIFIRPDGTIAGIVENAEPLTQTPRTVGKPSRYVLEVNGGWCARNGVRAGDRVELNAVIARAMGDGAR